MYDKPIGSIILNGAKNEYSCFSTNIENKALYQGLQHVQIMKKEEIKVEVLFFNIILKNPHPWICFYWFLRERERQTDRHGCEEKPWLAASRMYADWGLNPQPLVYEMTPQATEQPDQD